ncbi:shikimate kinase AroK [Hydrogenovibrio sp. SC-1]|uniref:shikimate kinase AroK n=1 Tax=Hydrogenovibrio sp. SC-1 TaxID=2065820 RepID=UPI000C7AFB2B|nr:shikimate kinase AroK [Hydrogenovibrio sp. SC-1]PLA74703.1 shikimate kinase AroK [Hydrogenovibrio sp. SC-1]
MFKESIFLVGLMGAGKSTVGRFLADRLHYQFVDSDHVIEERTGASIPMIFDIEGESGFRSREEQVIDEWTQKPEVVLATGGGAILSAENRKHLRSRGFVVYLKSSVTSLVQRTRHDRNRPLLQTEDPEGVLKQLIDEREPYYEEVADLVIQTEQVSIHRVVRQILDQVEALNKV